MAMKPHFSTTDMTDAQVAAKMKSDFEARNREMVTRDMGFGACPVVRIVSNERGHPEGFTEINLSDFHPSKHKLWNDGMQPNASQIEAQLAEAEIVLIGPNNLPATIDVGGDGDVALGDVVRAAQEKSGLSIKDWNTQSGPDINSACVAMVFEMTNANKNAKKAAAAKRPATRTKPASTPSGFQ